VEACSLSGDDLAVRLAEFRELLTRALEREHVGDSASFRFRVEDEAQLQELSQKERECCGFWSFAIRREGPEVVMDVAVTSPRFAHFVDRFYELGD
jgi:hypothetical protein